MVQELNDDGIVVDRCPVCGQRSTPRWARVAAGVLMGAVGLVAVALLALLATLLTRAAVRLM